MTTHDAATEPVPRLAGRTTSWWGMIIGLTALSSMHATIVFAYFYLAARAPSWPPPGIERPDLLAPTVATGLLVASLAPAAWAHTSIRAGGYRRLLPGVLATLALGAAYVAVAALDLAGLPFAHDTDAYGSVYWLLAVFHLLNAVTGLTIFAVIPFHVWGGRLGPRLQTMTVNGALFWYYVVGGWLVVYVTLYWSPYLW